MDYALCKQVPGEPDHFTIERVITQEEWDAMNNEPPEGMVVGQFDSSKWQGTYYSLE